MDALKIALETVLVGALAVPWMLVGLHLLFPDAMAWIKQNLPDSDDSLQYAVTAVVAVALAYSVGAAVSRLAQDFYNDDDFEIPLPPQDSIRASVFCDPADQPLMFDAGVSFPAPNDHVTIASLCQARQTSRGNARDKVIQQIHQVFQLQEDALLLMGEPQTSQIRHLHQELLVLQGAGFDGLMVFVLCLLAWNAQRVRWGYARLVLPSALFLYVFLYAFAWNHMEIHHWSQLRRLVRGWTPNDPPFMELTAMMLAIAGAYLVWRKERPRDEDESTPGASSETASRVSYGAGLCISLLLTGLAYAGWYWTEILYDRLVIFSYAAAHPLRPPL